MSPWTVLRVLAVQDADVRFRAVSLGLATLLSLTCLALAGCGPAMPDEMPGQAEALISVQRTFGYRVEAAGISWRPAEPDACPERPGFEYEGVCYAGLTYTGGWVDLVWRGSWEDTAFAHELMHVWQARRGVYDPNHTRAEEWALVAKANERLGGGL